MLVFPSAVLIPLCDLKYLMATNHYSSFLPEGFSVISNISRSLELILSFLPCKKWTDELQTSRQNPHKHILVLTHWGVSEMWSQVTQFLSPWAKSHRRTYFKRQKHIKNLGRACFYNENIDFMTSFGTLSGWWGEEIGQPPRKWQVDHQTLLSQAPKSP